MAEPEAAGRDPETQNASQEAIEGIKGPSGARSPRILKDDKEGLTAGQDWMKIEVEDAQEPMIKQPDQPQIRIQHHGEVTVQQSEAVTNGSGSELNNGQEDGHTDHDRTHEPQQDEAILSKISHQSQSIQEREGLDYAAAASRTVSSSTGNDIIAHRRLRSETQSTAVTENSQRNSLLSSMVFVVTALENIAASKEARKRKPLADAVTKALSAIKQPDSAPSPEIIFEPLRLATETANVPLTTTALDCIGKLISYSYFSIPSIPEETSPVPQNTKPPLIERAIETICDCFQDEATPAEVQLQIVKSLLAAVLNDKIIVHGAGLLKAVRQIYNIFLLSKSIANQQVAQGTLTQMVGTVFERVATRLSMKETRLHMMRIDSEKGTVNGSQVELNGNSSRLDVSESNGAHETDTSSDNTSMITDQPVRKQPGEKLTLQSFENTKIFDDARIADNVPTTVTRAEVPSRSFRTSSGQIMSPTNGYGDSNGLDIEDEEDEVFIKDAFLVFRSMCRLSTKILPPDQLQDLKSQNMRSKLISLHIIRSLLNNNMAVFTSPLVTIRSCTSNEPTSFGQATNQYLRLSLSRNGPSAVRQVFEVCSETFWLMLKDMRTLLKVR